MTWTAEDEAAFLEWIRQRSDGTPVRVGGKEITLADAAAMCPLELRLRRVEEMEDEDLQGDEKPYWRHVRCDEDV